MTDGCRRNADLTPRHDPVRLNISEHEGSAEPWTVQRNRARSATARHAFGGFPKPGVAGSIQPGAPQNRCSGRFPIVCSLASTSSACTGRALSVSPLAPRSPPDRGTSSRLPAREVLMEMSLYRRAATADECCRTTRPTARSSLPARAALWRPKHPSCCRSPTGSSRARTRWRCSGLLFRATGVSDSAAMMGLDHHSRDLALLPKAHLHLHLDGAMRSSTLAELAARRGLAGPALGAHGSFAAFGETIRAAAAALADVEPSSASSTRSSRMPPARVSSGLSSRPGRGCSPVAWGATSRPSTSCYRPAAKPRSGTAWASV